MKDSPWYTNSLEYLTALAFSCLPAPTPSKKQLQQCQLIGHRGAHQGTPYIENTLAGFRALADAGVWGIEMDIRWTKDLVPIIAHDADCRRLFNNDLVIAETDFVKLRNAVPQIPNLAEVVAQLGGKIHLMLEIKAERYPKPETQAVILQSTLANLQPTRDYHLLALDPALFAHAPFVPLDSRVVVGILNTAEASRWAEQLKVGGIAGAYPFFTNKRREAHQQLKQKIGVGHINSRRLLFREIAKGSDWIFSNKALYLQHVLDALSEEQ